MQPQVRLFTACIIALVAVAFTANNQSTLAKVAVLPALMFICYPALIFYFRSRGGYRQEHPAPH